MCPTTKPNCCATASPQFKSRCSTPIPATTSLLSVPDNEAELLRDRIAAIQESVLNAYPRHNLTAVGDWMLLAAIEALIDEHEYVANYHVAWFGAITRRGGSRGFAA
nr:DUF5631 domain-containing protein [Mycobacterium lacus]